MKELHIGSLDKSSLHLQFVTPWNFHEYTDNGLQFQWKRLFSLSNWWRNVCDRQRWDFWFRVFRNSSHRCYCDDGMMFDGRIFVLGFGFVWFFSRYWGDVPCVCDKAMGEMFASSIEYYELVESEYDDTMDNCGRMGFGGTCTIEGTEHCDFDCPFRNQ